jgi:hypothetical protein
MLLLEKYGVVEEWVPAFPTELVRGLKAHGTTIDNARIQQSIVNMPIVFGVTFTA